MVSVSREYQLEVMVCEFSRVREGVFVIAFEMVVGRETRKHSRAYCD